MKIKYIFVIFGKIISIFFISIAYFKRIRCVINSGYYSVRLKKTGSNFSLDYPVRSLRGGKYISIGNNVHIASGVILTAWDFYNTEKYIPEINIGNNISIGYDCHITAINRITIGNNCLLGRLITITDNSHGDNSKESLTIPPIKRLLYTKGEVTIGDNVWIGDKVTILPGVTIGDNVIIGANSVVSRSIPSNSVAVGVPAIVKRKIIFN